MAAVRDKKKFHKFLLDLKTEFPEVLPDRERPLLEQFVFYLLFYSDSAETARKVIAAFTDHDEFGGWNEVRVATRREICRVLELHGVEHADFLATRLKQLLQKVFEEADDTALEPLLEQIEEAEKGKRQVAEKVKTFIRELPDMPPWGPTYLLTSMGLESQIPWDNATEEVLEEQKVFPQKATLAQKKKTAKALLDGLDDLTPIDVHHLLVAHYKRSS